MEGSAVTVVHLIKDLVRLRPTKKLNFLNFLLQFSCHDNILVRETALVTVLKLHKDGDFIDIIEEYSVMLVFASDLILSSSNVNPHTDESTYHQSNGSC